MKRLYSHSKLSLFEQCPAAYKARYIDRDFPEIPLSVHLHLGSLVHESLEWLYARRKLGVEVSKDDLLEDFAQRWHEKTQGNIRTPLGEPMEFFLDKGIRFLIDYYEKYAPFNEPVIAIEKKIVFPLDDEEGIFVQGYIDRLDKNDSGEYEVHDYKTGSKIKSQSEADRDRQLAFYHLGLLHELGDDVKIKLVWHFLAHGKAIKSERTKEQLNILKQDTLALIRLIEQNTTWEACGKPWCDWCAYQKEKSRRIKEDKLRFF